MKIKFNILLFTASLCAGFSSLPSAIAIPGDELAVEPAKRKAPSQGLQPQKRVTKSGEGDNLSQALKGKGRETNLKTKQENKRQKVEPVVFDINDWESIKSGCQSQQKEAKKPARDALQTILNDLNHPRHVEAIEFARNSNILKPDIATQKFGNVLENGNVDQKEHSLLILKNNKGTCKAAMKWLANFMDEKPENPIRHRLCLNFLGRDPLFCMHKTTGTSGDRKRGSLIVSEILKNEAHPLFFEACRRAFLYRVYYVEHASLQVPNVRKALEVLTQKASDPQDSDHLEALLCLIIGNNPFSRLQPDNFMFESVVEHLKALCTPENHRIVEHLCLYGPAKERDKLIPALLENIRKGHYTQYLKDNLKDLCPVVSESHKALIIKAFKENSLNQGETLKSGTRRFNSADYNDPALFHQKVTENKNNKEFLKNIIEDSFNLLLRKEDEKFTEMQKEIYQTYKDNDLLFSFPGKGFASYDIILKFGDQTTLVEYFSRKKLHPLNFITEFKPRTLFTQFKDRDLHFGEDKRKNSIIELETLCTFYDTTSDNEVKQKIKVLLENRALSLANNCTQILRPNEFREGDVCLPQLNSVLEGIRSNPDNPYALDVLCLLILLNEFDFQNGKYKAIYQEILNNPSHKDYARALLNYALLDWGHAKYFYLHKIEELFTGTDEKANPHQKNDAAAIAYYLQTENQDIITWRNARKPFNEEGDITDFPTSFPDFWVDLNPIAFVNYRNNFPDTRFAGGNFLWTQAVYLRTFLRLEHVHTGNLQYPNRTVTLTFLLEKIKGAKAHGSSADESFEFLSGLKILPEYEPIRQNLFRTMNLIPYAQRLKALQPRFTNPSDPLLMKHTLEHPIWTEGLTSKLPHIYNFAFTTLMDYWKKFFYGAKASYPLPNNYKFIEEAPKELPVLTWKDEDIIPRIQSLIDKINKEDKTSPDYYDLQTLLDYKEADWEKSAYHVDPDTNSVKTLAQGYADLSFKTQATLKKLLKLPLTDEEKRVASPYNFPDDTRLSLINALKNVIEYMETTEDPVDRNNSLAMIVRGLLFCDSHHSEATNTAVLNVIFKKHRVASDFSVQLAGAMHEYLVEAFEKATTNPMEGIQAWGVHFSGQMRQVLHQWVGLPQVIEGHIERYNKVTSVGYIHKLIMHFQRYWSSELIIGHILNRAETNKKFNWALLGDVSVWLKENDKIFPDYGIDDKEAEKMKVTPKLLTDYLIAKKWLRPPHVQAPATQA